MSLPWTWHLESLVELLSCLLMCLLCWLFFCPQFSFTGLLKIVWSTRVYSVHNHTRGYHRRTSTNIGLLSYSEIHRLLKNVAVMCVNSVIFFNFKSALWDTYNSVSSSMWKSKIGVMNSTRNSVFLTLYLRTGIVLFIWHLKQCYVLFFLDLVVCNCFSGS